MKKILTIVVMAVVALTASAQVEKGFRNGIQASLGVSNVTGFDGDDPTVCWGVGWVAEYNFTPNFFLQSGINFQDVAHLESNIDGTLHGYFLQLPIHVGYRFSLGRTSALSLQAGPTLGYGIAGSKIEWSNGYSNSYFDLAKRFDFGIGARIGVEFSKFMISVGTNYGLTDAFEAGGNNFYVNAAVGYMF